MKRRRGKIMFLKQEELDKINQWLGYLACGIVDSGLTDEQTKEVLSLGCRCLDHIDTMKGEYTIPNRCAVIQL
jgi:hypothetical protein